MTPQQLKNSILQRAIEGRLVEQRPEEGTAKELLKEIKAEKAQLVKEGKIKKSKALPPITEEEKPFDIPEGWEWVRLGEIIIFENGDRSKSYPKNSDLVSEGIPFWGASDMINNKLTYTDALRFISKGKFDELRAGKLVDRDFVCLLRGAVGKWAQFYAENGHKTGFINAQMVIMRQIETKLCAYYSIYLNSYIFTNQIKQGTSGTAVAQMSADNLKQFLLPLSPLAEQHRIVAKIEEILPLIDKYDKAYTKLTDFNTRFPEAMKKSLLQYAIQGKLVEQRNDEGTAQELIKDIQAEKKRLIAEKKIKKPKALPPITEEEIPFDIPESWEWVRLGEISLSVADGDHQAPPKASDGIPFLVISNVSGGRLDFSNTRFVPKEYFDKLSSERIAELNDILFTVTGSYGIPILVETNRQFCFQRHIALIKSIMITEYLLWALNSPLIKQYCDNVATGTAQKTVGLTSLKNMIIPLPPLAEQHRIVAKLEEMLPFCDQLIK